MSRERGGALVTTVAAARRNTALPVIGRWCWWLKEVEVMAEQLWIRQIDRWSYVGGYRLWRSCGGDAVSSELCFGKAEREGVSESGEWSEQQGRGAFVHAPA